MKHCGTARPLHHTHPLLEDPAARILSECAAAGKLYLSFSDKKKLIGTFHTQIIPALGLIRIGGQQ
nr:hypothetical protein [uncultured Deefgea sp.]